MATTTAVTNSTLTPTAVLLHTLTNVGDVSEPTVYDPRNRQGVSISDTIYAGIAGILILIVDGGKRARHVYA